MFVLAHVIEAILFVRYYFLLPFVWLFLGGKPSLLSRWMGTAVYLQPATLKAFEDVVIDDSRARKVLGYVCLLAQWFLDKADVYS